MDNRDIVFLRSSAIGSFVVKSELLGKAHRFPPLGRCMYCGSLEPPLTNEHIIPKGLGGRLIAPASTCEACRVEIRGVEEQCLRPMLGPWRLRMGYPSGKPKQRPETLLVPAGLGLGDKWTFVRDVEVAASRYPRALVLPTMSPPRILTRDVESVTGFWAHFDEADMEEFHTRHGLWPQIARVRPDVFLRMLAKIAHGFATMALGYGSFHPTVTDLILGRERDPLMWVGCDVEREPRGANSAHFLRVDTWGVSGREYVGVNLQLFAHTGAPEYIVVVGERSATIRA